MVYSHSMTSILAFTFSESRKGKPTADVIAIGNNAVKKLASKPGQQFANSWRVLGKFFFIAIYKVLLFKVNIFLFREHRRE